MVQAVFLDNNHQPRVEKENSKTLQVAKLKELSCGKLQPHQNTFTGWEGKSTVL